MARKEGQFIVEDFHVLAGGLNTSDSPFIVEPTQARGGINWDYSTRGAITKRRGVTRVGSQDTNRPNTLGLGLLDPPAGTRSIIRVANATGVTAGRAWSLGAPGAVPSATDISDDTASANKNFFGASSIQPVVMAGTATASATNPTILWCAGGGFVDPSDLAKNTLLGIYSATKATTNGVPQAQITATTSFTAAATAGGSGGYAAGRLPAGKYVYTVTLIKKSTGAEGNALDAAYEAGDASGSGSVTITAGDVTKLKIYFTSPDLTKYEKFNLYRSQVVAGGGDYDVGFTAGVLIGQMSIPSYTMYVTDFGDSYVANDAYANKFWAHSTSAYQTAPTDAYLDSSSLVPRAGSLTLDNSPLPSGVYNNVVVWNGRLVTAETSNLYISEVNKPESWPLSNRFPIPSGGKITGLAVVGLASGVTGVGINEALIIFKEREMWTLLSYGAPFDYTTWQLTFMGSSGCPSQRLCVNTDSGLFWLNNRGIFSWNGAGKPRLLSQPIEDQFVPSGDIQYDNVYLGYGIYYHQKRQIRWTLGSNTYGNQKYTIKLDLRLTMAGASENLTEATTKGIFTASDIEPAEMQAALSCTSSGTGANEYIYSSDNAGWVYRVDSTTADLNSADITLQYDTPHLSMGTPGLRKRFNKVVVWVSDVGQPDLGLTYWSDWKEGGLGSEGLTPVSGTGTVGGLWDTMTWDSGTWFSGANSPKAVVFNLNTQTGNNAEGATIKLRLHSSDNAYTPTIYGFSVYYTEVASNF